MLGCFKRTAAKASYSDFEYIDPLGLFGELSITNFVLGVMACSSCSGVILKSVSIPERISIGFPSARITMAE